MLTGLLDPRDRRAARRAGIEHFFVKPPDIDRLIAAIREAASATTRADRAPPASADHAGRLSATGLGDHARRSSATGLDADTARPTELTAIDLGPMARSRWVRRHAALQDRPTPAASRPDLGEPPAPAGSIGATSDRANGGVMSSDQLAVLQVALWD